MSFLHLFKRFLKIQVMPHRGDLFSFAASRLSLFCLIAAVIMCFNGRGPHRQWIVLALIIPALRLAFESAFRSSVRRRCWSYSSQLEVYSRGGDKTPIKAIFVVIVVPAAILYLFTNQTFTSGDTWPVIVTASRLVHEGDVNIAEYVPTAPGGYFAEGGSVPYCAFQKGDHFYSSYPPGMTFFATPVCCISRLAGADFSRYSVRTRLEKWTASWVAALCIGLFFAIATRIVDIRSALVTVAFLASGSAMMSTMGHALAQHGGVIFWGLLAVALEFTVRGERPTTVTLLQGLALGMMLSCRLSSSLIVGSVGLWIGLRSISRGLTLSAGIAFGYLPWALFNLSIYGSPLGPSRVQMGSDNWEGFEHVGSVLFSPGAGLFVYQPWLLLIALLPILHMSNLRPTENERPCPPGWIWMCLLILVLQVALVSKWKCWWGGDCWGSRLLSEAIPFAALSILRPVAFLLDRRWGLCLLVALAVLSAYLHIFPILFRDNFARTTEDLLNWSCAPFIPKL